MPSASFDQASGLQPICHIISPVGMLGYGFDEALTAHELSRLVPTGVPTAIVLDSGSTDSGPEKLALGGMSSPRSAYVKDLTKMLRLMHQFRVPLVFGSAGGDGSDEHVKLMGEIIEEICAEEQNKDYGFKTVSIFSGIDKTTILKRLRVGRVTGCGPCVPALTESDVEAAPRIVAQIGPEPYVDAMEANPDFNIIVGGRSYDPAPYVGYSTYQLKRQFPQLSAADLQARCAGFTHMGKIMECGGQCSKPKSPGAVATVYASGLFDVRPTSPESICTAQTVAAHTLYENTRPDLLRGPGGALHLDDSQYETLKDGKSIRVRGSKFVSSRSEGLPYCFKLEAAKVIGYRTTFMGSIVDPILINQLDSLLPRVKAYVDQQHPDVSGEWDIGFHIYGKGGPGAIFLVVECLAPTQQLANSIAAKARVAMIHAAYPGQKATAGNFGFGLGGKMDNEMGPCAVFCVYHLMELEMGEERLTSLDRRNGAKKGPPLLRATVAVLGKGQPMLPNDAFIASIALLQDKFPIPDTDKVHQISPSARAKISPNPKVLADLALVLRSKNAGPYEITLDAIFATKEAYLSTKNSNLLSPANVAKALEIPVEDIVWMGFFEPALAFKVTIPRVRNGKKQPAGGFMEHDIHGSQQHVGFANIKLPYAVIPGTTIASPLSAISAQPSYKLLSIMAAISTVTAVTVVKRLLGQKRV